MNQYIKAILATQGWHEIEKMFKNKIQECSAFNLPKEGSNEVVAREARVSEEVTKELTALLKKIKMAGAEVEIKKPKKLI